MAIAGIPSPATRSTLRASALGLAGAGVLAAGIGALRWYTEDRLRAVSVGRTTADEAIGLATAAALWFCLGWLVLSVLAGLGAQLPGAIGRGCSVVADAVVPWSIRRLVTAIIGLTMVGAPSAIAATTPSAGPPHVGADSAAAAQLVRVDALQAPRTELPPLDRPARPATVVVEAGDCLWTIVARALGAGATAAEIAAEWPRWYAANRDLIGPDPNLIRPGQELAAPG